ncbi:hypothetical protein JCM5296_004593 [Sporobolomyces johnsonii]
MADKTTPTRFANDLTNLSFSSSSSAVASSSRPPKSARTTSYRQTSLADSFFRSSSPIPVPVLAASSSSVPATPLFDTAPRVSTSSSSCTSSPTRRHDDGDLEMEDEATRDPYDELDEQEEPSPRAKRRRTVSSSPERDLFGAHLVGAFEVGAGKGKQKMPATYNVPGRQMSAFQAMQRRELGFRAGSAQVSMRPYLETLLSSNEEQVVRIPSLQPHRNFAPPFALAFSQASKAGGKQVVAVADEEGSVSFLGGEKDEWTAGPSRHSFRAHANAVFDLSWSRDDQLLATASGDQTVRLWDTKTQTCVAVLSGHTCTIKNVSWDPYNSQLLSTASRDGSIRVWDRRVRGYAYVEPEGTAIGTVNHIKNAHGTKGKGNKGRSATRSVTAVAYLQQQENLLASAGSADSVVKIWDLRRSHSRRVNPAHYETNEDALLATPSARPHGIASMQVAPDGRKLYALSTDSRIYAFDPLNLTHPAPLRTLVPPLPSATAASFYVRCAVSPCSRYLASGSADGSLFLWDTEGDGTDAVRVRGHEREVSGLDWGHEGLATCSDDHLVRHWRFNPSVARRRTHPTSTTGDWVEEAENRKLRDRWSGEVLSDA